MLYIIILFIFSIILSMFGLGGGVFYTPFFHYLNFDFNSAATNSQILIFFTTFSASLSFFKHKKIEFKIAFQLMLFMVLGNFFGGYTAHYFYPILIKIIFLLVISFSIYKMVSKEKIEKIKIKKKISYSITIFFGYIAGLLGIGGGAFLVPLLKISYKLDLKKAIATSSFIILLSTFAGIIGHLNSGITKIDNQIIYYIVAVLLGGVVGANISVSIKKSILNKIYISLLIFISILIIIK